MRSRPKFLSLRGLPLLAAVYASLSQNACAAYPDSGIPWASSQGGRAAVSGARPPGQTGIAGGPAAVGTNNAGRGATSVAPGQRPGVSDAGGDIAEDDASAAPGSAVPAAISDTESASDGRSAQRRTDRVVLYDLAAPGVAKPITWGLDLAWLSEANIRRGVAFMGRDRVDVVRSSFMPTDPVVNGALTGDALKNTNERLNIIRKHLGANTQVVLNSDSPSYDASLTGNAVKWAELIDVTLRYHQEAGRTVIGVSPLNEPDYTQNGQGDMNHFLNIAAELEKNTRLSGIRISGGNTLNADQAWPWYDFLKVRLDEGNTHQLAGSFDSYAAFFPKVRANGHHASNDELHNVMEAIVGAEYGMQTGIWWGTAELARAEFVKASNGVRLGYAEHRPNWTAAAVYRAPDGKVQAFAGTSERQALATSFRFVSRDRDVYYDGHGPQREYTVSMPGGTGYQQGQTNAERVVNIAWGDDIQPVIDGRYVLLNKNSRKVLEVARGATSSGASLQQGSYSGATYQQWDVHPVDARIGGDFSYIDLSAAHSGMMSDVRDWSLEEGGEIIAFSGTKGANQQWYLEYAGDGWFRVRSRHSAKALAVLGASRDDAAKVVQSESGAGDNQLWRMLPVDADIELDAPSAPSQLEATSGAASVLLRWQKSPESDVAGYNVLRAEAAEGPYTTLARSVTANRFVDNTVKPGTPYYYAVKAIDRSLNRSDQSNRVMASTSGDHTLLARLAFDGDTRDSSPSLNHATSYRTPAFALARVGSGALRLDGANDFVQLPPTLPHQRELSVATWVNWSGGASWQRIFDFGNDQTQNMFLTASSAAHTLRFVIRNGGGEQMLEVPELTTGTWTHVAVTLGASAARLYVDGRMLAESTTVSIRPSDFHPVLNYIGQSQYPDALFAGAIDDFRVYNYALTDAEVAAIVATP